MERVTVNLWKLILNQFWNHHIVLLMKMDARLTRISKWFDYELALD